MSSFKQILEASRKLALQHPGHVFIGGVAVYLHAVNNAGLKSTAEASHDADLMLSLEEYADLKDTDEVSSNRRLSKHQLIRGGIEFDVYVERQNKLVIPYDEALAHSIKYSGMRIASPEHLLILKLEALSDRIGSSKGDKDVRDIVTLSRIMKTKISKSAVMPFLRDEHLAILDEIVRSPVFRLLADNNDHQAKKLRGAFEKFVEKIRE